LLILLTAKGGEDLPLVIFGEPYEDSMITFRPFGPRVVATAFANVSTPARRAARPSTPNLSSCHAILVSFLLKYFEARNSSAEVSWIRRERTLCANLSCCPLKPETAGRSFEDERPKTEALEVNARCMMD